MVFSQYKFKSLDEIREECERLGLQLNFSENLEILKREVRIKGITIPNSLACHPMEGSDGNEDGSPGELTIRRNMKYAGGGAGLIWFEAIAVVPEGRASRHQLMINRANMDTFRKLLEDMRNEAKRAYGENFRPVIIAQLTHSGRFSRPKGIREPVIGCHDPYLDARYDVAPDAPIVTDEYLEALEEKFVEAALLAREAGFDGVDLKACHKYLASELLGAFGRKGKYGGDFEGRSRFLFHLAEKVRKAVGDDYIVGSRVNIYDGIPYPYGFGVDKENADIFDASEPLKLIGGLKEREIDIINITMGTPYWNPHVNRPYDKGGYIPNEHPLEGVARMVNGIGRMQKAFPELPIVGTGYSWLREFSQYLAAGSLENGYATIIGYGRMGLAYPDFARDILAGGLKKSKCCISCSKCSDLLRAGQYAGCVVRDNEIYGRIYAENMLKK